MKIEITDSYGNKTSRETGSEDIGEVMEDIRGVLLATGFVPESIVFGCQHIIEEYGEHSTELKKDN